MALTSCSAVSQAADLGCEQVHPGMASSAQRGFVPCFWESSCICFHAAWGRIKQLL